MPEASLLDVNGALYGTTIGGGSYGYGTVFKVSASGQETILHSFNFTDGSGPVAQLTNVNGTLYGTTLNGGAYKAGTVFGMSQGGKLTTIYNFTGDGDGSGPLGLINVNGTLYGTTDFGGTQDGGTVFSVTTTGKETVLHRFTGGSSDGLEPMAGLLNVGGTLYGTTSLGGSSNCGNTGCGAVFSVTTSGSEKVLHGFAGPPDGESPEASLINISGTLYGTTAYGGNMNCPSGVGCGTVFSITTSGNEKVLYNFAGSPDGAYPKAKLTKASGILYGTTAGGGAYSCHTQDAPGCGTVFSISSSGAESVIYSFAGRGKLGHPDGSEPWAGVIDVNGTLYGTTTAGGKYNQGTIYELVPSAASH
ncbi:MAG: hypothetical protein JO030_00055 [Candidatus Eremiobacteraeota bacterium]|nr:hypothetical protein [Candidatus Eremiobacteraeota bacterium]